MSKDTRAKQMRAMMVEAKRRVREEAERKRKQRKQKKVKPAAGAAKSAAHADMPASQAPLDVAQY